MRRAPPAGDGSVRDAEAGSSDGPTACSDEVGELTCVDIDTFLPTLIRQFLRAEMSPVSKDYLPVSNSLRQDNFDSLGRGAFGVRDAHAEAKPVGGVADLEQHGAFAFVQRSSPRVAIMPVPPHIVREF
jgi:hypothetical protein